MVTRHCAEHPAFGVAADQRQQCCSLGKLGFNEIGEVARKLVYVEVTVFPLAICFLQRSVIGRSALADALRDDFLARQQPAILQAE